jgi:hypothetical protein
MSEGPRHDGPGTAHEGITQESPRDLLEKAEFIPEPTHEELAHALGRLLVWQLEGGSLDRIGERVLITAYKLRPDLIGGATLAEIARHRGLLRSHANKMSRQFTRTFGIRGINGHATPSAPVRRSGPFDTAIAKAHGVADHLKIVNRFCEWRAFHDEGRGAIPTSTRDVQLMRRDLEPIARFIAELDAKL